MGRQDVRIKPLRGNLDTRLKKLDSGEYHAIVLAAAGLKRLGLGARIRQIFDPETMLPSAGQGALGIEIRSDRADLKTALAPLIHQPTWLRVAAERAVSRALGGSCSVPLAAHATWADDGALVLDAAWGELVDLEATADLTGVMQAKLAKPLIRAQRRGVVADLAAAEALGLRVAQDLLANGAVVPH